MLMQTYPEKAVRFGAEAAVKKLKDHGEDFLKDSYEQRARTGGSQVLESGEIHILSGMKILAPELFRKTATPERMERYTQLLLPKLQEPVSFSETIEARELIGRKAVDGASQEIWEGAKKETDEMRKQGWWANFVPRAASLRLLFPERFAELGIDGETRKNIKAYFQKVKKGPSHNIYLPEFSVALKILAAEEIKLAENGGIEIVMRKPKPELKTETPPMPEKKNF
jgi:hypothetical protein